jgi:hypothetical protein
MVAILGVVILAFVIVGILSLRHYTTAHGSPAMKTAMKIGDFFIWVRFIGFAVLLLLFLFIAASAKHSK